MNELPQNVEVYISITINGMEQSVSVDKEKIKGPFMLDNVHALALAKLKECMAKFR